MPGPEEKRRVPGRRVREVVARLVGEGAHELSTRTRWKTECQRSLSRGRSRLSEHFCINWSVKRLEQKPESNQDNLPIVHVLNGGS